MNRTCVQRLCIGLCLTYLGGGVGVSFAQEKAATDIVFVLDISKSMTADRNFEGVRTRLVEFIEGQVDVGATVVVVTFGHRTQLVADQQLAKPEDKKALIKRIKALNATGNATFMTAGIDLAMQSLLKLKKQHPDHSRMIVLLSDGKNEPPRDVPERDRLSFADLRKRYANEADFQPGDDWFMWYCYIGEPDPEVTEYARGNEANFISLDGPWRFLKARLSRVVVKLGQVPAGNWEREFPLAEDRELGEVLSVTTTPPGKHKLVFSDVLLEDAKPGEKITVSPRDLVLGEPLQNVVLKLKAEGIVPGRHRGRILLKSPGRLLFVTPQQLIVTFDVQAPLVAVRPRDGLDFGLVGPGTSAERTLELSGNEEAVRSAADVKLVFNPPLDLPPGITMTFDPPDVILAERVETKATLAVAADVAVAKEGYSGSITWALGEVRFEPPETPVRFQPLSATVTVTPPEAIDFGAILPGEAVTRELFLTPDDGAISAGSTVDLKLAKPLPKGLNLAIEPRGVLLDKPRHVRLTMSCDATVTLADAVSVPLGLSVRPGSVVLSSKRLLLSVRSAKPAVDVTPRGGLGFGELAPGGSASRSFSLVPNEAAVALEAEARLSVRGLSQGVTAILQPEEAKLDGTLEVKVTISAALGAEPGRVLDASIKIALSPDLVAPSSRMVALDYEVSQSLIWVDTDVLRFENVLPGDSQLEHSLRFAGTPGAIGKTLQLDWQWQGLPDSMKVAASPAQVTLANASEQPTITLNVSNAVAGTYHGRLKLAADGAEVDRGQIELVMEVGKAAVIVHAEVMRIPVWQPAGEHKWPITIEANKYADGATATVVVEGELPAGMSLSMRPASLAMGQGTNQAELSLRWDGHERPTRGTSYPVTVHVQTDRPELLLENADLALEVVVPFLSKREKVAIVVTIASVLALLVFLWLRWPRKLVGALRVKSLAGVAIQCDGLPLEEGENFSLESLGTRRVVIGAEKDCELCISQGTGYYATINRCRSTVIRRHPDGIKAVWILPVGDSEGRLEPGRSHFLDHGDEIRIDNITLVYEDV